MNQANLCVFVGCYSDPTNSDVNADDDLPSIDDLLAFSRTGISTVYQKSADTPQHLEGPALNINGSGLDLNARLDNGSPNQK